MAEPILNGPRVMSVICQPEASGVAQHVGAHLVPELGSGAGGEGQSGALIRFPSKSQSQSGSQDDTESHDGNCNWIVCRN